MNYHTLLIYIFVSFFYIISPGPAVFLAIYNGISKGTKVVMVSALGNIIGLMMLSALSVSGLSAILMASATLFTLVKVIGALYLIYLGIRQIWFSTKTNNHNNVERVNQERTLSSYFREGLLVAATNPKPILFFAALFPQFLDVSRPIPLQFIVMTLIFMTFSFLSLSTYGYLAQRAKGLFINANNTKWFHRLSGGLFIGMGVSLFTFKNAS